MADNRKIKNKIRGEKGTTFNLGMEDELAAACDQQRLDELKAAGAIEGDWRSTLSGDSPTFEKRTAPGLNFVPLTIPETLEAMRRMDFSERVTRSMTFHGDALKEAMKNYLENGDPSENKKGEKSKAEKPKDRAEKEKAENAESAEDEKFPKDFPGYDILAQVEEMTPAKLKTMSDEEILAIKGIKTATLKAIREYK